MAFFGACTTGLFENLSTLILICAQSGRVSGLERKNDPAGSPRSSRKGLKDNNNRLLCVVNKFNIQFGTESTISICEVLDRDCTVVTLHRVANFCVKHLNSAFERTQRGIVLLLVVFILLVVIFLYRFSVK